MILAYLDHDVGPSYPTIRVRVINQSGKKLKIYRYEIFSETEYEVLKPLIKPNPSITLISEADITSNDFTLTHDPGICPVIIVYGFIIVAVEDGSGNVVESLSLPFISGSSGIQEFKYGEDVYVVYISPFFVINRTVKAGSSVYVVNSTVTITIIKGKGWLKAYRGRTLLSDVNGRSAILNVSLKIHRSLAYGFLSAIDRPDVARIVFKLPIDGAVRIGAIAYVKKMLEESRISVVASSISFDGTYYTVDASLHIDLYSSFDWRRVLMFLSGVASVVAGSVLLALSFGVAIPASVYMIATGVSLVVGAIAIGYVLADKPSATYNIGKQLADVSLQKMRDYARSVEEMVNLWLSQGRITKDEADTLMGYVHGMVSIAEETITTLVGLLDSCKEEGKREMYPWIAIAGVGGVLAGVLISRRRGTGEAEKRGEKQK